MDPNLLGPLGLTVGALVAVGVLWRDHQRADADDRQQRDTAIAGWKEAAEATRDLAAAIRDDTARRAVQHRKDDPA